MKIEPKLINLKTRDKITLPGLFYSKQNIKKAVIFLHGNGNSSVFYNPHYVLAEKLNKSNIAFLEFNNRGAHYIKKLKQGGQKKRFGMAYEKIKDCIKDIDAAVAFLTRLGFKKFYLLGESTGANKICVYNFYKPKNKISKYILLGGGDDVGFYYDYLGKIKFWKLLKKAKNKIRQKKGGDIINDILPELIFSYTGFYDIANPDGDYNVFPFFEVINNKKLSSKPLFRHFKNLNKPALIVYGGKDQYAWGNVERVVRILKGRKPELDYSIIKNADHSCSRHQKQLAKLIVMWLN